MRMRNGYVISRDRRIDFDDAGAREEPLRRSLSPQLVVEENRTDSRGRRSGSLERRREYGANIGGVHGDNEGTRRTIMRDCSGRREYDPDIERVRGEHVLSRSPPVRKRPYYMDERACIMSPRSLEMRARSEYAEHMDYNMNARSKISFGHNDDVEGCKLKDSGVRRFDAAWRDSQVESVPLEDDVERDVQSLQTYGYATIYGQACTYEKGLVNEREIEDESIQRQDALSYQKMTKNVYYEDGEKSAYSSRASPYPESPPSHIKVIGTKELPEDLLDTSDITVRGEYQGKLRAARSLPSEGYSKRFGKAIESLVYDDHGTRGLSDTMRVYEAGLKGTKGYACDCYTTDEHEHKGYECAVTGLRGSRDPGFSSGGHMYPGRAYNHVQHDQRRLLRPDSMDVYGESMSEMEYSHSSQRISKHIGVQEHDVMQKERAADYVNTRKSSDALMQAGGYPDSDYPRVELKRRVPDNHHISDYGYLCDYETDDFYSDYGYGNNALAISDRPRLKVYSELENDEDIQRLARGSDRMADEDCVIKERILKRKYTTDEEISRVDVRSGIHGKWHVPSGSYNSLDHEVEWTSRKASGVSKRPDYEQNPYFGESKKTYDDAYHHKNSTNVVWTSYENESISESSGRYFGMGNKHLKGYTKSESSKSYDRVHHSHQRSNRYDQPNLRPGNESDNPRAVTVEDSEESEKFAGPWKHDLCEDSDVFKQKAQAAFLDFSKRLHENPFARRLYREDGRAGSLFCIVCRRSASKEFQNTRALATHAYMSHKVGLRPLHLGLHRAICVLMGWNTMPDADLGNWAPEALPPGEALAKKQDLILWPPAVIIHNISLSYNDHNEWKLINIDTLEEFLRGKGFHLGKMRICLGNPGDHSVILVKFLGTFSGLQEAQRLHKYFLERNHGRTDFQEAISSIGKGSKSEQGRDQVEKLEDVLLYGYMGISEDFDRVDFDSRKRCSVKSKMEIHDIADAPVKPLEK